jgi:tRNA-specific 2-thiouridylase
MSGGVDSSVAAWLLKEAGHEVIGVFMRHGEEAQEACAADGPADFRLPIFNPRADHKQGCCSASDADDARRVADKLDIPFYALNLQAEFRQIIDYFIAEYTRGRTPNPCVQCNNWLKFGKLFDYADSVGAEFVATGHYARVGCVESGADGRNTPPDRCVALHCTHPTLLRGIDESKDQSYVLFGIERQLLSRMLLPVGEYRKPQIRAMASKLGLRVADKKDSQEICFVTSGKHDEFVRQRRRAIHGDSSDMSGQIVTTEGRLVGTHPGIERFTIGQRKGLGVAMGEPYFVVRIEPDTKKVIIGRQEELAQSELTARNCNWLIDPPAGEFPCTAKIRYNSPPAAASAERLSDGRLHVHFDEPRYGVAPGQAVVLYDGERVIGGGWID